MRFPPLIPLQLRRIAVAVAGFGWLMVLSMGVWFAGHRGSTAFDDTVTRAVHALAPVRSVPAIVLAGLTTPALSYAVLAVLVGFALLRKHWELAGFTVLGPGVCLLFTELVAKPLVGRTYASYLSYPSGHTVSAVSAYLLATLVLVAGKPVPLRVLGLVLCAVLSACLGAGLVAMSYHYPTDVIGGFGVAVGVLLPGALVVDTLTARCSARTAAG